MFDKNKIDRFVGELSFPVYLLHVLILQVYQNEEKYIGACLSSLTQLTVPIQEIIVVDDRSTDNSLKIIRNFQRTISNFQLIRQKHQGMVMARMRGVKAAKGEIVAFLDADMTFDKKYLETLVLPIAERKATATFTKAEYVANLENMWAKCWSINNYLPGNLRILPSTPDKTNSFRAILRDIFMRQKLISSEGYYDDITILHASSTIKAKAIAGAICYHFNPSSLSEVYSSARWMGRGIKSFSLQKLLIFSPPNSIRRESVRQLGINCLSLLFLKLFSTSVIFLA